MEEKSQEGEKNDKEQIASWKIKEKNTRAMKNLKSEIVNNEEHFFHSFLLFLSPLFFNENIWVEDFKLKNR